MDEGTIGQEVWGRGHACWVIREVDKQPWSTWLSICHWFESEAITCRSMYWQHSSWKCHAYRWRSSGWSYSWNRCGCKWPKWGLRKNWRGGQGWRSLIVDWTLYQTWVITQGKRDQYAGARRARLPSMSHYGWTHGRASHAIKRLHVREKLNLATFPN